MTIINGTNAGETINGSSQADSISAGNGNDTVNGGAGNDFIDGGNGNDVLNGGADSDTINGDNGDDTLDGGSGNDQVNGGNGHDILTYRASENVDASDIYNGDNGTDTLRLVVSQSLYNSALFQTDLAILQAKLNKGSASYDFQSIHLSVTSIEQLQVIVEGGSTNHGPVANDDTVSATEDSSITI